MTDMMARRVILDLTTEDSYAPSEIVARLQTVCPHYSVAEARALIRRVMRELFDRGLIRATWLETPDGVEEVLESESGTAALADDLAWLPHKHWRPHVRISATHSGHEERKKLEDGGS